MIAGTEVMDGTFHFDEWLRQEMEKRQWDKYDLSVESGISHTAIYFYLRDGRLPNLYTFKLILKALNKHLVIVDN